ncbi:MAG: carbohydrate binding family 9 domain-containing protein [Ignavibacteria bacterium]|nr:carbohydrate binding family 9 domain-containing protein [Ignavibacteria bacterium]
MTGELSDPRWHLAQPVEFGFEVMPGENSPAPQRTSVRILHNSDHIYVGFDCKDTNPSAIRAHITDRDKIFDDDFVGITLDTYGDLQRSYEFMVNPYGIQADLMRVGDNEYPSFDTVWKTSADIGESGWSAEMAFRSRACASPQNGSRRGSPCSSESILGQAGNNYRGSDTTGTIHALCVRGA